MSRIVDRDRGRSVLMSGIVWCYLESLVTTSGCKRHSREFLWAIRDRGRKDADCYKNVAQPGWQEASLWINDFYRVTIPGTICDKRKQSGLSTEVKIYLGYLLRVQRPASLYLFDTFCPDYCGDNLSCDRQYLETLYSLSASHLWLEQLITREGIMLPADNEGRVTRQLASQDTHQ